jgi:hypothetical protein
LNTGEDRRLRVTGPRREQKVLYRVLYDIDLLLERRGYLIAVAGHTHDTP